MSETTQHDPGFDGTDTIWLDQPLHAYGERIDKLVVRRPTGKDLRACGNPISFRQDGSYKFDVDIGLNLLERLANVPTSTLDDLSYFDVLSVEALFMTFLPARPRTSSTDITMSPGNGAGTPRPSLDSGSPSSLSLKGRLSA